MFAFRSPFSKGAILADEVGLGKTIEAGIVISQKWAEHKRNLLIVAPASLRQQWSNELLEKFHIQSVILDSQKVKKAVESGEKLINGKKIVIVSYNFAASHQELMQAIQWDLVVFDEAHKLRNVYKPDNVTSNTIKQTFKNTPKLLLTATPLQNSLLELYGLVSIIDDNYFGMFDAFKDEYTNVGVGVKGKKKLEELRSRLRPVVNRSLRRQVQEYIKYTRRRAFTQQFTPTPEETQLYNQVTEYLAREELYAFSSSQRTLTTLLLLKLLGSSSFAISHTLKAIAHRVEMEAKEGVRRDRSGKKLFDQDILDTVSEDADEEFENEEENQHKLTKQEIEGMLLEADELRAMARLAESIVKESKGDALLAALSQGFSELPKYNAKRKAIVFTESTRTQAYLVRLLEENGYKDKVVAFNGSGGGEKEAQIYKEWLEQNKNTDKVSGVKTSDRRSAVVDYFKEEAEIMVATEAAGEGINLQFCSMVINYDLPWNPQRVEQRIGRCHRYGQKSDVLVFNFLNSENRAEQRILQLLSEKFLLFDGVFGASDEILGVIESGFDFERHIADIILQSVRTPDQIDNEFDAIQKEFSHKIEKQKKTTRQHLIDNFDSDVQEKLKIARGENKYYMDRNTELLWKVTTKTLDNYAEFHEEGFTLNHTPRFADQISLGTYGYSDESKAQYRYRFNHPLAQSVLDHAKTLHPKNGSIVFDYSSGSTKITNLEKYVGSEGYLELIKYSRISQVQSEEHMLVLAKTKNGEPIKHEVAARLFDLPAEFIEKDVQEIDLSDIQDAEIKNIEKDASERDNQLMNEEFAKISSRADDLRRSARIKLKKREAEIRQLKKDFKSETDMNKRLEIQRIQILLQRKQDDEEHEYRKKSRAIDDEMLELNDRIKASIDSKPQIEKVFSLHWKLI